MKKDVLCRLKGTAFLKPADYYLLIAAVIVFLDITLLVYTQMLYEFFLSIPCLLFLGIQQERGRIGECKKKFVLPGIMVAWFLVLRLKHGIESARIYNAGLFVVTYLFAYPLASLLQDGEKKRGLKTFAIAYLAAAISLAMDGALLGLGRLPDFMIGNVYWDGARLWPFWHPNMAACFMLIGIVFCVSFLQESKSWWLKIGLLSLTCVLLRVMAVTNSRTTIMVTGVFLGATLFFMLIKRGRKWFIPGVLAAAILAFAIFTGAGQLYQANYNRLARKYIKQQQTQQMLTESAEEEENESNVVGEGSEPIVQIAPMEYVLPFAVKVEAAELPASGAEKKVWATTLSAEMDVSQIQLPTSSGQGTLENDLRTLNGRTGIWRAALTAIRENPSILIWGAARPVKAAVPYGTFKFDHLHNAWIECLLGMGLLGLLVALAFTLIAAWNSVVILIKHHRDAWKRSVALLVLCLMAISVLEPYLFYTTPFNHPYNFLFFICVGYLVHWQEEDNRQILSVIRSKFFHVKGTI